MRSLRTLSIIGLVTLAFVGCSTLRLGYSNGSTLAWWWLDSYLDVNSAQTPRVKEAIARWFDWHRPQELPRYAAFVARVSARVGEPVTPGEVCQWQAEAVGLVAPALDRALELAAEVAPQLGEAQWRHLEQRQAKRDAELRDEMMQGDVQERRRKAVERTVERAERIYGKLDGAQRQRIAAAMAGSPFDAEVWMVEREHRQRDLVQTLRRIATDPHDRAQALPALRALAERWQNSPRPAYRAHAERSRQFGCQLAAQIHNLTTPAQRATARERLAGWETDLRVLSALQP